MYTKCVDGLAVFLERATGGCLLLHLCTLLDLLLEALGVACKALLPCYFSTIDDPNVFCDASDKELIMRYHHNSTIEGLYAVRQRSNSLKIKVVRRLIQNEDVRSGIRNSCKSDSTALTS